MEELLKQIADLESEQAENEYGSCSYDFLDIELQSLYSKLDQMKKEVA